MTFAPAIINHTNPQVSVYNADSGVPPVSYKQIKNSLGQHIYSIQGIYLQSNNLSQLIGTIQYNRYEATGEQSFKTITTTVDPYQSANAIDFDLTYADNYFILNGNSNLQTTILPLTYVDATIYNKRITNSFGRNLNSFKIMEEIFRKPNFFQRYGDIEEIQKNNLQVEKSISFTGKQEEDNTPIMVLGVISTSMLIIYLYKKYVV
jgi:hypothetical protein